MKASLERSVTLQCTNCILNIFLKEFQNKYFFSEIIAHWILKITSLEIEKKIGEISKNAKTIKDFIN